MNKKILFTGIIIMMILFQVLYAADLKERWDCSIDLNQGTSAAFQLNREDTAVTGIIIFKIGQEELEHAVAGQWIENEIQFTREISKKTLQPFKGTVTWVNKNRVNMAGKYTTGYKASWMCECKLIERKGTAKIVETQAKPSGTEPVTPVKSETKPEAPVMEPGTRVQQEIKPESPAVEPVGSAKPETEPAAPPAESGTAVKPEIKPESPKEKPAAPVAKPEMKPTLIIDFLEKASAATWANASSPVKFADDPENKQGSARIAEKVSLENFKLYDRVLVTCPQRQPGGIITARYSNITIPESGAEFSTTIGFLQGSVETEGVFFEVYGEFPGYTGIPVRRTFLKPSTKAQAVDFTQDLSRFKGLTGTVVLSVEARNEALEKICVAWIEPKLVSIGNVNRIATFIGGAVGSGRNGNQLVNPWGTKSGNLYGDITLYLLFANVNSKYTLKLDSYRDGKFTGSIDFGEIKGSQTEIWHTLYRTMPGEWIEHVIYNETYVGDIKYIISQ